MAIPPASCFYLYRSLLTANKLFHDIEQSRDRNVVVIATDGVHRSGAFPSLPEICNSSSSRATQQERSVELIATAAVTLRYEDSSYCVTDLAKPGLARSVIAGVLTKHR